jgi:hypothetical protein
MNLSAVRSAAYGKLSVAECGAYESCSQPVDGLKQKTANNTLKMIVGMV